MRRLVLAAVALFAATTVIPKHAFAQMGPGGGGRGGGQSQDDDEAKKKKRDEAWGNNQAPLPALRNAGPCPYVKSLYDAARYVEFKDNKEASANVGYTGEIDQVGASCAYKADEPIKVSLQVLFELGRGPQADSPTKVYHYWIAVTDRNRDVIAKQTFDLPVTFPTGQDRMYKRETVNEIVIPRATSTVSGANFEVLVGFDVTPQMAEFNRQGKRFRPNVAAVASQDTQQQH